MASEKVAREREKMILMNMIVLEFIIGQTASGSVVQYRRLRVKCCEEKG